MGDSKGKNRERREGRGLKGGGGREGWREGRDGWGAKRTLREFEDDVKWMLPCA